MTPKTTETLETQIEQLVRRHLAEQQLAARAAVERAFVAATPPRQRPSRQTGYKRRARVQMMELADRLYEAVRGCPGETMTVIAARVGERAPALNRPMLHLKRAGRVRSAGERNLTRYFPMMASKVA